MEHVSVMLLLKNICEQVLKKRWEEYKTCAKLKIVIGTHQHVLHVFQSRTTLWRYTRSHKNHLLITYSLTYNSALIFLAL